MMRSSTIVEVTPQHKGQNVTLTGWVHSRRDHGGVLFIDLRDRSGLIQIVFNPESKELFSRADPLRSEYVIQVTGVVRARPEGTVNPNIPTGQIEVVADSLTLLNRAKPPPLRNFRTFQCLRRSPIEVPLV